MPSALLSETLSEYIDGKTGVDDGQRLEDLIPETKLVFNN